ncbi:hypothetical protein [Citrobacter freundii]|uniref:hypothetical protein n=1 Tax=Citrobacter freundii TaxID=546 RepID=UPI001FFDF5FD|nr:hypothetical protein [Citrobacter freundii]WOD69715.1 hypothetical protein PSC61_07420 [Citrobacter freundii]
MNVYEMEGFLRGKCLPGDMKVNESNAQYQVRIFSEMQSQNAELAVQLANAESKCRELAVDNASLKNPENWLLQSDYGYEASEVATQNGATEDESLRAGMIAIINRIGTPATDDFLAEVRAQGVEMFADHLLCPDLDGTIREFAAQLRKGAKS